MPSELDKDALEAAWLAHDNACLGEHWRKEARMAEGIKAYLRVASGAQSPTVGEITEAREPREIQFHLDRLDAWLRTLWAANNLTLYMCDGTIRTGQHGLLDNIREDAMALHAALSAASLTRLPDAGEDQ